MASHPPKIIRKMAQEANAEMIAFFDAEIPKLLRANKKGLSICFSDMASDDPMMELFNKTYSLSPEDYLKKGIYNRIGNIYTNEEYGFIQAMFNRFGRVHKGFAYFSLLRANMRPLEALRLIEHQPRTGWRRVGVPLAYNERVGKHQNMCAELAKIIFEDDSDRDLIVEVLKYHDVLEVVTGDFTPHCPITKQEKKALEFMALKLVASKRDVFLSDKIVQAFNVYESGAPECTELRSKIRDIDLLQMCLEALSLVESAPEGEKQRIHDNVQEFWEYVGNQLVSEKAQKFFNGLQSERYKLYPSFAKSIIQAGISMNSMLPL